MAVPHGQRIIGEIDIAMCAVRYGLEVDGPWHLLDGLAERDRARDRRLARHGWVIDRFTDDHIRHDPAGFVDEVRAGFTAAAARRVDPWPCRSCSGLMDVTR